MDTVMSPPDLCIKLDIVLISLCILSLFSVRCGRPLAGGAELERLVEVRPVGQAYLGYFAEFGHGPAENL